jgi:hypothetical protein
MQYRYIQFNFPELGLSGISSIYLTVTLHNLNKEMSILNNYIQSIQHLPRVIETDALDSFAMLSRCVGRIGKPNISLQRWK